MEFTVTDGAGAGAWLGLGVTFGVGLVVVECVGEEVGCALGVVP
ncbi:MAG TPA: hypothetical protein VFL29_06460 [Candidatus Dormibacteraeota bacterium]|nr:hypothetical protein [Candidatus Dormibacteraeota bacterium]